MYRSEKVRKYRLLFKFEKENDPKNKGLVIQSDLLKQILQFEIRDGGSRSRPERFHLRFSANRNNNKLIKITNQKKKKKKKPPSCPNRSTPLPLQSIPSGRTKGLSPAILTIRSILRRKIDIFIILTAKARGVFLINRAGIFAICEREGEEKEERRDGGERG